MKQAALERTITTVPRKRSMTSWGSDLPRLGRSRLDSLLCLSGSLCRRRFAGRRGQSRCRALWPAAQKFPRGSGLCPPPVRISRERCGRQLGGGGFGILDYWLQKPMEPNGKNEIHTKAAGKDDNPGPIPMF